MVQEVQRVPGVLRELSRRLGVALPLALALAGLPLSARQAPPAQAPAVAAALAQVDSQFAADFAKDGAGGASVGILLDGKLAWTRHYGFADVEAKRVATNDTDYRIGSITKQFTALMLLQLVEHGVVALSDPIEKYVPEIRAVTGAPAGAPPITLLQVATMTSGLAREPGCANPLDGPVSAWEAKVVACLPTETYANEPGTQYLYSNFGYATLGLALERAAAQPYTSYVLAHILTPLGMSRTALEATTDVRANLAHGYARRNAQAAPDRTEPDRELDGRGYKVPNGAILSTVNDLAKFAAWELGAGPNGVLKKSTQDGNYSRVYSGAGPLSSGYGLGFMAERRGALVFIGHAGSTSGYLSAVFVHRASKTAVIVLHNGDGGSFNPTNEALSALAKIAAASGF